MQFRVTYAKEAPPVISSLPVGNALPMLCHPAASARAFFEFTTFLDATAS